MPLSDWAHKFSDSVSAHFTIIFTKSKLDDKEFENVLFAFYMINHCTVICSEYINRK
jgi:hypothetical protein